MEQEWSQLYIGGEWQEPVSETTLEVVDPSTEEIFAAAPCGGAEDIEKSVHAAEAAYQNRWSKLDAKDRVAGLQEMAEILDEHADEIAELETRENGKPLEESERDVEAAIEALRFYAGAADKNYGKTLPDQGDIMDMTVREPYGVVGAIIPWNWPPMHVCDFLAPVLASGNTLVLKPAPETPLCALRMAELFDGTVPDGVFNVVTGGAEAGSALAGNPTVGKLAFTGNTETGTKVLESAAQNITSTMLELGGKNASIIFEDAALDEVVPATINSAYYNGGEACSSSERLLVHEDIHDEFLERFRSETETLVVGSGTDPETDIGPLSSSKQFEKVSEYISVGKAENAELVFAGDAPDGNGYFIAPHIFDNVDPNTRLFTEEVFGPVISITTFGTEAEAIDLANRVEYGLAGAVWSTDAKRAMRVARNVDVGYMMVNTYYRGGIGAPFGGYGRSGNGRKFAFEETMQEFSRVKTIRYNTGSSESW